MVSVIYAVIRLKKCRIMGVIRWKKCNESDLFAWKSVELLYCACLSLHNLQLKISVNYTLSDIISNISPAKTSTSPVTGNSLCFKYLLFSLNSRCKSLMYCIFIALSFLILQLVFRSYEKGLRYWKWACIIRSLW